LTAGANGRINHQAIYRLTIYEGALVDREASVTAVPDPAGVIRPGVLVRTADVARDIARGGLAGLTAGIVVGGVGGRIVMRLAMLLSPESVGRLTENGNPIGTITLGGSLAVLLFMGLAAGVIGGVVWVAVSSWIPGRGMLRVALAAGLAVSLGGLFLVSSENSDFIVLSNDPAIIALLLGLLGLLGATVAWLDARFEARLPPVAGHPGATAGFGIVAVLGLVFVPGAIGFYIGDNGCGCTTPPIPTGGALLLAGVATLSWWAIRIATGRSTVPPAIAWAGRAALLLAAGTGLVRIGSEVTTILGN
jgi:hypothetical protein